MNRLVQTNPALFVIQSRLYDPNLYVPSKWVLFHPHRKKPFLINHPQLLFALAEATEPISGEDFTNLLDQAPANLVERLLQEGILIGAETTDTLVSTPASYTEFYHAAVFDYPFRDYSRPNWLEEDIELMESYQTQAPPPSIYKSFTGTPLPIDDAFVSNLLYLTLGQTGEIPSSTGTLLKRTSPSGGGRHPTEGFWITRTGHGTIAPGIYGYDVQHHALVPVETDLAPDELLPPSSQAALLLTVRPERAMWRYRDMRSLRPMIVDIGHIGETFKMITRQSGFTVLEEGIPQANRLASAIGLDWLEEPAFQLLHITNSLDTDSQAPCRSHHDEPHAILPSSEDDFLLNPFAWISFADRSLVLHVNAPKRSALTLDRADFQALTHCVPSLRGDRVTSRSEILLATEGLTPSRLERLIEHQALVPRSYGKTRYKNLRSWTTHGWYLSLLHHALAAHEAPTAGTILPPVAPDPSYALSDRTALLLTRKTTRSFRPAEPVSSESAASILRAALTEAPPHTRLFLCAFHVSGLAQGVYEASFTEDQELDLMRLALPINRESVQQIAIGQQPAGEGDFVLLCIHDLNTDAAHRYEERILSFGNIGQRICLEAARQNLGVFLTPAVRDARLFTALPLQHPTQSAAYLFSIGRAKEETR